MADCENLLSITVSKNSLWNTFIVVFHGEFRSARRCQTERRGQNHAGTKSFFYNAPKRFTPFSAVIEFCVRNVPESTMCIFIRLVALQSPRQDAGTALVKLVGTSPPH